MSVWTVIEGLFSSARADITAIEAGFATADRFVGQLLGEFQQVAGVVGMVDPAIGLPIEAGVAAVQALRTQVEAAVSGASGDATGAAQLVTQLMTQAADLSVLIGPFFKVVANDAGTALAAAMALGKAGSPAPATP